nr:MAG TPA: hypothetical protein [Caudoviricetes sp.]
MFKFNWVYTRYYPNLIQKKFYLACFCLFINTYPDFFH